jgi:hypothetical protein
MPQLDIHKMIASCLLHVSSSQACRGLHHKQQLLATMEEMAAQAARFVGYVPLCSHV